MNSKTRRILLVGLSAGTVVAATVLFAHGASNPFKFFTRKARAQQPPQNRQQISASTSTRNLSMQPQAFQLGRRLGKRFAPTGRDKSVAVGTITVASQSNSIQIVRSQTDSGEQVQIQTSASLDTLTWDAAQGSLSSGQQAVSGDRDLIEKLVFDSPDQFVLAQLRGAAYYTVERNVRPANVDANYSGPVWDVVRVSDPEPDENKQPLSRWRLYYLNTRTGLIDKIESEVAGQRVSAEILGWADVNGEKVPSQIRWSTNGSVLMEYTLSSFSHAAN